MIEVEMQEIIAGSELYVGSEEDFRERLLPYMEGDTWALWSVVHACKEPHHRALLGYKERAAPKDHPEYLWAFRGERLFLNLVDAAFIPNKQLIDTALTFMATASLRKRKVFVHCNEGKSRAPTLMMLMIAPMLSGDFSDAEAAFKKLYPDYAPNDGMRTFAMRHWDEYHAREFGRVA